MSESWVYRDCPVCDHNTARPLWHKGELRVGCCERCGLRYANPVAAEMSSGEFYEAAGHDYYLSPDKLASDYAPVRFARELRLFRNYCRRGAVLDVGCSSGAFLFQLRERWPGDYRVVGTDASGPPLDYAASRGVPVVRGDFLEMTPARCSGAPASGPARSAIEGPHAGSETGAPFDAITFWAVLEHLAEPRRFLEKAHSLLKPGGHCFVLVPNVHSLATRLLGARYRYVYAQHLNYFSKATLTRLVTQSGFAVVATRCTHFNPLVIWQDWRGGGREVSNAERAQLLRRTTACKQNPVIKPLRWAYTGVERLLGAVRLADNLVLVLRKP